MQFSYYLDVEERNMNSNMEVIAVVEEWAASHDNWDEFGPVSVQLGEEKFRRIAIVSGGETLIDTRPDLPLPTSARYPIDIWKSSTQWAFQQFDGETAANERAMLGMLPANVAGAFDLSAVTRSALLAQATETAECLGLPVEEAVRIWPNGRPFIHPMALEGSKCSTGTLAEPAETEQRALDELTTGMNTCLIRAGIPPIDTLVFDPAPTSDHQISFAVLDTAETLRAVAPGSEARCFVAAAHAQSDDFVAPPVDLYLTDHRGDYRGLFDLSPGSNARIVAVVLAILTLVLATAWYITSPVLRQVTTLSRATRKLADGDLTTKVPVHDDEFAELATTFNTMARDLQISRDQQSQMVNDTAHELRTPLTNLRGWIEGAQDGVVTLDRDLLTLLHSETMRLQHIASDLQTLTLADAGRLALNSEEMDLSALIEQTVRATAVTARKSGITLAAYASPDLKVFADLLRLRQVLDNLIANAINHSNGTMVTVGAKLTGDFVEITVADNGQGVSGDALLHLFDRFWRGDPSRSRHAGGSGLGLSIAQRLVTLHHGTIEAKNLPRHGLIVTVRMPA